MPHEPNYNTPPFTSLLQVPRRLSRQPASGRYQMPDYLMNCWSLLEVDLTAATCLLQVHYDAPCHKAAVPFRVRL